MNRASIISVAIATYNGSKFIKEQLTSILVQLKHNDEIIISDNYSTDNTIEIINSFNDKRIKIFYQEKVSKNGSINCYFNFQNALMHSIGDIIFLSDQDDLWHPEKVKICLEALDTHDIVVSDCKVMAENGNVVLESYFSRRKSGNGFLKNLVTNTYLGCCMAFKREVLDFILPFPKKMPMHDILIGTVAELFFKSIFIKETLVYYREHSNNVSPTAIGVSRFSFREQIIFRWKVIKYIPLLFYRKYIR